MSSSEDAWIEVSKHLRTLGSMALAPVGDIGDDERVSDSVPSDDEFKEAVRVIGERASAAFGSLTESIQDPDIRAETKETASAILRALSVSFSELATRLSYLDSRVTITEAGSPGVEHLPVDETEA